MKAIQDQIVVKHLRDKDNQKMLSRAKETCRHLLICISEDDSYLIASADPAVRRPGGAVTTNMSDFMEQGSYFRKRQLPFKASKTKC